MRAVSAIFAAELCFNSHGVCSDANAFEQRSNQVQLQPRVPVRDCRSQGSAREIE